jgi:hypothetical protein
MKTLLLGMAFCLLAGAANAVPVEKDAQIYKTVSADTVQALATLINLNGYKCTSVSSVLPMVFSTGFHVNCNQYRYSYDVEDQGGRWIVTLD